MRVQKEAVQIKQWLIEPLSPEVRKSLERLSKVEGVRHMAVMPDVHLSGEVCIGTVVATKSQLIPQAVGGDIGCGMSALKFLCNAQDLLSKRNAAKILEELYRIVPSNRHSPSSRAGSLPDHLLNKPLSDPRLEKEKKRDGLVQWGTLGRGNHFLEFQANEEGRLWLTVHSGSRAMGQLITHHHLKEAPSSSGLYVLEAAGDKGFAYWNDAQWACDYAESNRLRMLERVADFIRREFGVRQAESSLFSCNHNHVRLEDHFGETLWVHRKGALPANEGEPGIIPGSMGTSSFHTAGRGEPASLRSSSHGAGRTMSRDEARRRISVPKFEGQMNGVWFDHRMSPRLVDEAPSVYKKIDAVMRAQRELTRIIRKLEPGLNYKGR